MIDARREQSVSAPPFQHSFVLLPSVRNITRRL
jgi:hypothetical protein